MELRCLKEEIYSILKLFLWKAAVEMIISGFFSSLWFSFVQISFHSAFSLSSAFNFFPNQPISNDYSTKKRPKMVQFFN